MSENLRGFRKWLCSTTMFLPYIQVRGDGLETIICKSIMLVVQMLLYSGIL